MNNVIFEDGHIRVEESGGVITITANNTHGLKPPVLKVFTNVPYRLSVTAEGMHWVPTSFFSNSEDRKSDIAIPGFNIQKTR